MTDTDNPFERFGFLPPGDEAASAAVPIHVLTPEGLKAWREKASAPHGRWMDSVGFTAQEGEHTILPDADGNIEAVLVGRRPDAADLWTLARLPGLLPKGAYRLETGAVASRHGAPDASAAATGWALASYRFDRYRKAPPQGARLVAGKGHDIGAILRSAEAVALVRTLINTPAGDMGPSALAAEAEKLAGAFGASIRVVAGEELLAENLPSIHAVGRAAADAPRLIDLVWGDEAAPKVTLVGKGVCFDTGGLDLKPAAAMKMMKKDMGGAATVLGLARMVMHAGLPVRLRVLIPAVENSVSGNAYRPLDVIRTRAGITVEIGNTDAEGRVVLADALALACEEDPALVLDYATLTGAARVALGTELPALFSDDDALAADLLEAGAAAEDPMWRLPLWNGYEPLLKGDTADITNAPDSPFGGAITAALFLRRFVKNGTSWAHIDTYGWNAKPRPGRPKGGEALAMRAAFDVLCKRFGG